jgi:hypothetical protein
MVVGEAMRSYIIAADWQQSKQKAQTRPRRPVACPISNSGQIQMKLEAVSVDAEALLPASPHPLANGVGNQLQPWRPTQPNGKDVAII